MLESDIPETAPGEDELAKYQVKIDELKHKINIPSNYSSKTNNLLPNERSRLRIATAPSQNTSAIPQPMTCLSE